MRIATISAVLAAATLAACAKPPSKIPPVAVSSSEYDSFSCSQITNELTNVTQALAEAEKRQRDQVAADAVTVFLVLVPASALAGDNEAVIGKLKGEKEALERARSNKRCA